jgi:hypothetical protein
MGAQYLVVPIGAFLVQPLYEDLPSLEFGEHSPALLTTQKAITDRAAEAAKHACIDEEASELRGQLVENLAREVLADEARRSVELGQEPTTLLRSLPSRGQVKEVQARCPALCATGKLG